MARGRKPFATAVHKARGNPSHKVLPKDEPQPPPADVDADMPDILSDEAKACWRKVHKVLSDAKVLTVMDTPALVLYCEAFARYDKARREMRKPGTGMVINSPTMGKKVNPWMHVLNKAHDQMLKVILEYGMTPAARTRVRMVKDDKPSAPPRPGAQGGKNVFQIIRSTAKGGGP